MLSSFLCRLSYSSLLASGWLSSQLTNSLHLSTMSLAEILSFTYGIKCNDDDDDDNEEEEEDKCISIALYPCGSMALLQSPKRVKLYNKGLKTKVNERLVRKDKC